MSTTHEVVLPLFQQQAPERLRRYATVVADPPWRYDSALKGLRGATVYPTMNLSEIQMLPVGEWAQRDAHLYLWTTDAFMEPAHDIARAWGFTPKNVLVWVKGRSVSEPRMSVGFYYRHACEFVLFCVRGSLSVLNHDQPNVFAAPRTAHSEKPDAFYDMVERMSPGPYLDVFSRRQRFRWDTWGNEAFDFREHGIWHDGARSR